MAEIAILRRVWLNIKMSICQWHGLRAIKLKRIESKKLSTTPYNAIFSSISKDFEPSTQAKPIRTTQFESGKNPDRHQETWTLQLTQATHPSLYSRGNLVSNKEKTNYPPMHHLKFGKLY